MRKSTLITKALCAAVLTVFGSLFAAASADAQTVTREQIIGIDGIRTGAYSGRHHYSVRQNLAFNEFCVENTSPTDKIDFEVQSTIIFEGETEIMTEQTHQIKGRLGCFKHSANTPASATAAVMKLRVCVIRSSDPIACYNEDFSVSIH